MLKPLNIKIYLNLKSTLNQKKEEKVRAGLYDTRLWGFKQAFAFNKMYIGKCSDFNEEMPDQRIRKQN